MTVLDKLIAAAGAGVMVAWVSAVIATFTFMPFVGWFYVLGWLR